MGAVRLAGVESCSVRELFSKLWRGWRRRGARGRSARARVDGSVNGRHRQGAMRHLVQSHGVGSWRACGGVNGAEWRGRREWGRVAGWQLNHLVDEQLHELLFEL